MICESEEGQRLLPFVKEVFSLDFEDKPNYEKLRFHLVKTLLDINETPSTEYDWNVGIPQKVTSKKVKAPKDRVPEDLDEIPDEQMISMEDNALVKHNSLED